MITAMSSMLAITLIFPPHASQVSISMSNTRLRRCAQLIARCRSAGVRRSIALGFPRPAGVTSAHHQIISARGVLPTSEWRLVRNGLASAVRVQPRLSTTTNDSALAAAIAGFGITRLLSYQVAAPVRDGRLVLLLRDSEPEPVPVHVVHREGRNASRKVPAFLDLAIQRLRGALQQ